MNHLSSPCLHATGILERFVNSICRLLPCKLHHCFLLTASKKGIQRPLCPSLKQEYYSKEGQEDLTFPLTLSCLRSILPVKGL